MKTVVVGMSGGVDSSLSALLLKQQGYNVIGLFMKNWEEQDEHGRCRAAKEYEDVVKVCEQIAIPHYAVNFAKEYREQVFTQFLHDLQQGHTPNPDVLCNREIKFKVLFQRALALGADYLATGHYCRTAHGENGCAQLLKGIDMGKDQSYFLYAIDHRVLPKVLFPIGDLPKEQVRALAREHGLATAEKKDSTGICFIGKRNFKEFVAPYLQYQKGTFETVTGEAIGNHDGVAFYTIGQRKGLGIGGPGEPWFVVGKDIPRNVVILAQGELHPALYSDTLEANEISWLSAEPPVLPLRCSAKIRYRQPDQSCLLEWSDDGRVRVTFEIPQRAATLRQSVVFYSGEHCLGGGMISQIGASYYARQLSLPQHVSP
jgi:tRNA-specific 2-thiouridylase